MRTPIAARRRRSARPHSSMVVTSRTRCTALPSFIACPQQVSTSSMHAGESSPETVRLDRCSPSSLSTRNTTPLVHCGFHSRFDRLSWVALVAGAENVGIRRGKGRILALSSRELHAMISAPILPPQNSSKRLSLQEFLTPHQCDEVAESYRHLPRSGCPARECSVKLY